MFDFDKISLMIDKPISIDFEPFFFNKTYFFNLYGFRLSFFLFETDLILKR